MGKINCSYWHCTKPVTKVFVKLSDPQTTSRAVTASNFSGQHCWVGIENSDTEIPIKKGSTRPSFKRTQYPLTLSSIGMY